MTRTAVIHQPDFLPHLAFFHRLLQADVYVVLDHVQFVDGTSRSWMHRDKIKTPRGPQWITVGVRKAPRDTPIDAIELADTPWRTQHLNLIRENYRKAPFFDQIFAELEVLYARPLTRLVDFTLASIEMLLRLFDIGIERQRSSAMRPVGHRNELLVDLLRTAGATRYLSGPGARAYFDPAPFAAAGIDVIWQNFTPPIYPQLHGPFVAGVSSIDLLFNCGIEHSRDILRAA